MEKMLPLEGEGGEKLINEEEEKKTEQLDPDGSAAFDEILAEVDERLTKDEHLFDDLDDAAGYGGLPVGSFENPSQSGF